LRNKAFQMKFLNVTESISLQLDLKLVLFFTIKPRYLLVKYLFKLSSFLLKVYRLSDVCKVKRVTLNQYRENFKKKTFFKECSSFQGL